MAKKRRSPYGNSIIPYLAVIVGITLLVYVGKVLIAPLKSFPVLGTTSFLAKGGDDSSEGEKHSSEGGGSGSSGSKSSGSSENKSSGESSSGGSNSGSSGSSNTGGTIVAPQSTTQTNIFRKTFPVVNQNKEIEKEQEIKEVEKKEIENKKQEVSEVKVPEAERIRTRTKDGRTRIDITSGGVKTRLEIRDDRVIIKAEQEDGTEVELEDNTIIKIEDRLSKDQIKVATAGGKFIIQRGTTGAATDFPLSLDLATNTLIVNTPAGARTITILPDQAVQGLLASNVISKINLTQEQIGTRSASQLITLGISNGIPIYEITGVSNQKLLGFIPVNIQRTAVVSAQTGQVATVKESPLNRVLDLISF